MTSTQRGFASAAAVVLVALLSWLTISAGAPQIYAPANLLAVLPALLISGLFERGYLVAVALIPIPLFFCLWCWPVFRGRTTLPARSVVLLLLAVVLSAAVLILGFRLGIEYQGISYVIGVSVINVACWILLGLLALLVRHRPSFGHNLGFHTALFAWLGWGAFPYLGEAL